MLRIRLFPKGKKHQRTFRIVVTEKQKKANGKFLEDLGFYTPQTKTLKIDKEAMESWVKKGAQISEGVDKLLHPEKYPIKKKKNVGATLAVAHKNKETIIPKTTEAKKEETK
ncbi:30S ribosomal protein S16 [Patescibacteria group bacterium]|nr:30S ribosomal protein S16 [Patescibacteria group bacterium]MBU4264940.1 30S ribosomal protein S16 [Patescibacteria group bacterium]MBU4389777.1 30S ribosomal protein S16 [Patescibacteria group bacterium]MBU4396553.1 30S ribosomal protein S16 [Patescibacteria group bacterium]MBU4430642.1 30S ribosomal protein S16 [Patescibacteria group bacterium]